jgi:hypothetical protein
VLFVVDHRRVKQDLIHIRTNDERSVLI